jgi:predicted transcriptional regulator
MEEKKRYAQEMFGEIKPDAMAKLLGVSLAKIYDWTSTQAEAAKDERDRKIVDLYLKAWNTQKSIADIIGVTQPTVDNICENIKNRQLSEFYNSFKPVNQ